MKEEQRGDPRVEHLYREYVRLSASVEKLAMSSFEDFKLLGAIAAVAAWPPIADWLTGTEDENRGLILFAGFGIILLLVAMIGTRDLLKQSLIRYLGQHLKAYERELSVLLGLEASATFRVALDLEGWERKRPRRIARRFLVYFQLVFVVFPAIVLAVHEPHWYVGPFLGLSLVVVLVYESARSFLESETSLERRLLEAVRARGRADRTKS